MINAFPVIDYPLGCRRPRRSMPATFRNRSCWKRARISSWPPRQPLKNHLGIAAHNGSTTFGRPMTPYVVRTASGKYAKFEVTDYDRGAGRVTIKYLYQSDGTRNLNSLKD